MDMGDPDHQLCLKWNNFGNTVSSAFHSLHAGGELIDVTLAAEGQQLQAHRLVLAACSPYFREILKRNPCEHPIIILREVSAVELRRVLLFMYQGQVNVPHSSLADFIRLAEALKVKGLSDSSAFTNTEKAGVEHQANSCSVVVESAPSPAHNAAAAADTATTNNNYAHATAAATEKRSRSDTSSSGGGSSSKRKRRESSGELHSPAPAASPPPAHSSVPAMASQHQQTHPLSPPSPQLKTEIQDMLEVKLEGGDSPEPVVVSADGRVAHSNEGSGAAAPNSVDNTAISGAQLFILPRPNNTEQPTANSQQIILKSTANLQPEFPLDPSGHNLPYPCPFCDKAYMSWGFRRRHIKGCHTTSPELPCKWCPTLLPSHNHWEIHVQQHHNLPVGAARNGLLILEEAHMVLQFATPTRIHSLMELIKNKKTTAAVTTAVGTATAAITSTTAANSNATPNTTTSGATTSDASSLPITDTNAAPTVTSITSSTTLDTIIASSTEERQSSLPAVAVLGAPRKLSATTRRQKEEAAKQAKQKKQP